MTSEEFKKRIEQPIDKLAKVNVKNGLEAGMVLLRRLELSSTIIKTAQLCLEHPELIQDYLNIKSKRHKNQQTDNMIDESDVDLQKQEQIEAAYNANIRTQAAISAMQGIISNNDLLRHLTNYVSTGGGHGYYDYGGERKGNDMIASLAVRYANNLIKELKKGQTE